jgi:hypothetical protein
MVKPFYARSVTMRARRIVTIVFVVLVCAAILYAGWEKPGPNNFEAAFQPGGEVVMDLSIGGFTIRGTPENKISVEISQSDLPSVHSQVTVNGNQGKVRLEGPSDNFNATIYVPQNSNLRVSQTIGELRVEGVDGDKHLNLNIGEIRVPAPGPDAMKTVDASVKIGEVHADAWHRGNGGFFPSFHFSGKGQHSVSAIVDIGQVQLTN